MKTTLRTTIATLFLSTMAFATVTVDGYAYLENQSDHSGVTITFVRTAPSSLTETVTNDASGYFTADLETGIYDVTFTKDNYFSSSLTDQSFWSNTTLTDITLLYHPTLINVPSLFSTIQEAINNASDGDTILVQPGTYTEGLVINKSLLIGSNYIIDPDTNYISSTIIEKAPNIWNTVSIGGQSDCSIIGLTINNGVVGISIGGWGPSVLLKDLIITENTNMGVNLSRANVIIENCLISNNGGSYGGIYHYQGTTTITKTRILDNATNNAYGGGGILAQQGTMIIDDVLIKGNSSSNGGGGLYTLESDVSIKNSLIIENSSQSGGGGIQSNWGGTIQLDRCTISNNAGPVGISGASITNCIVSDNNVGVAGGNPITYSNFYNNENGNFSNPGDWLGVNVTTNANGDSVDAYGNIQVDPLFVDTANRDYHLTENSPCIDAGDPTLPLESDSTVVDMGAYWYDQSTLPVISSSPVTTVNEDVSYQYQLVYTGIPVPVLSLQTYPAGMTLDGSDLINWLPDNNDVGDTLVTIVATNGLGSNTQIFTLTVNNINDAPVITSTAMDNPVEDETYNYTIQADDDDSIHGDNLAYSLTSAPSGMTIGAGTGLVEWSPVNSDVGTATVTVLVTDDSSATDSKSFSITILNTNDAPIVSSAIDDILINEDTSDVSIDITGVFDDDDIIVASDSLTLSIANSNEGLLNAGLDGLTVNLSLLENQNGSATITVTATDDSSATVTDTFIVTVNPINDNPVLTDIGAQSVNEDTAKVILLTATDIDEDDLTYTATSTESNVTASVSNDTLTLTPADNWNGTTDITVTVTDDGTGTLTDTETFTVTINAINDAPVISIMDSVTIDEDNFATVNLSASDIEGDGLTYSVSSAESNVTATVSNDTLTLTPSENWNGTGNITVFVNDGFLSDTTSFVLTVIPVNDAPEIILPDSLVFSEDGLLTVDFTPYFNDIDSDTSLVLTASGNDHIDVGIESFMVTFTADTNWNGYEDIVFTIDDQNLRFTDGDTIRINVFAVNDAPVISIMDSVTIDEDNFATVNLSASDIEGDGLTYSVSSAESNVTATVSNDTLTMTLAENWNGTAEITVFVSDGFLSDTSSFVLTVTPMNDAPEIMLPDSMEFSEDGLLTIDFTPYLNDIDSDTSLGLTASGNNHIDVAIESFMVTYTADTNWNGFEDIVFTIDDQNLRFTDSDTVRVNVLAVNDAPVITALDSVSIDEDNVATVNLSATDIENDDLTYSVSSAESNVTATVSNDTLTLTPSENWNGTADITVFVNDGFLSDTSSFVLTVNPVNDAPVVIDMNVELEEDGNIEILLTGSDIDGDDLTISVINAPVNGTYADSIYTPNLNFTGTDSLSYLANDGFLNSDTGTVFITVTNTNDAPYVLQPIDDVIVDEDSDTLSLLIDGVFDDIDILYGDTLSITAQSLNDDLITIGSDSNMVPFMVFALNGNGETNVIVTATDLAGLSVDDTVHVIINAVNDAPSTFSLISPENVSTIILTNETLGDTLWFDWSESIDVDGDSLSYTFELSIDMNLIFNQTTTNPSFWVENLVLVELLDTLTTLSGVWSVMVSDGQDSVLSDNGPFTFTIDGSELSVDPGFLIPEVFALHQNYPNPFNPTTQIKYDLPEDAMVSITIYDIMGRSIKSLVNSNQSAGYRTIQWNATNDEGKPVSAGLYLYTIQAGDFRQTKKMVLLK